MFDQLSRLGACLHSLGLLDESRSVNKIAGLMSGVDWEELTGLLAEEQKRRLPLLLQTPHLLRA